MVLRYPPGGRPPVPPEARPLKKAVYQARLNYPLKQATIAPVKVDRVVTSVALVNSIDNVPSRTADLLTKRRAVDFCRVAAAMCSARPVSCAA